MGDIGLFLGALLAALLANEFRVRKAADLLGYLEAAVGGVLMAVGVVFASGCNWGGFFSAITALSLHGYLMFPGLLIGGLLGALYVDWRTLRTLKSLELGELPASEASVRRSGEAWRRALLLAIGVASALAFLWLAISSPGGELYAGALLIGLLVGVVIQRSRFCFATAFRDLLKGGGEFERSVRLQIGIILAIAVGAAGVAILKYVGFIEPQAYVKSVGWINIVGGTLFGLGMVIAGGCASASLWRAAEGHLRLWAALIAAIVAYAPIRFLVHAAAPWIYGEGVLITGALGWVGGLAAIYASLLLWFLFLVYLAYRRGARIW